MYKAKQKTVSLIVACLTFFVTIVMAFACLFSAPTINVASAAGTASGEWTLVTNASTLAVDDKVIIAAKDSAVALSTTQGSNNRGQATVTKSDGSVTFGSDVQIITLEEGSSTGTWAFHVTGGTGSNAANGYLFCASTSSKNYLRTQTSIDAKASWTITIDSTGKATVQSKASVARNILMYNSTSSCFACYSSGQKDIILYKYVETNNDCTHTDWAWTFDSKTNEHYKKCTNPDCEKEIADSREACSEFTYGAYTTANGVHTRTATCTVCDGAQIETGNCQVESSGYVREGNKHSQTGTCSICDDATKVTEDCTLTYENVPNNDKTHDMTSTCSVCKQSSEPETVECTFEKSLDGTTLTYTCKYCEYSYTEEATMFTVTYIVPNGITAPEAVDVADGYTTNLATADAMEGYTFVGWTTEEYEQTTEKPEFLKGEYAPEGDVTLYALYSYSEGDSTGWNVVTDITALANNSTVTIVAPTKEVAIGTFSSKYFTQVSIAECSELTLIKNTDGTYSFKTGNNYLALTNADNALYTNTAINDQSKWNISISNDVATITSVAHTDRTLQYNASNPRFACYTSKQTAVAIWALGTGTTYYTTGKTAQPEPTPTPETKINGASLTLGKTLTMNYYVTLLDEHVGAILNVTMTGEEAKPVEGVLQENGQYVFSFEIPPQYMATTINAQLVFESETIAELNDYSIKKYAQNQLNDNPDDELEQLLTDLLYYGDAAYNFVNGTTDETPVTNGVENIGTPSTATPDADTTLVDNPQISEYPAYFVSAGVWFDNVNKLYVRLNTTENVTLKINNVEVEVTGKTVYTDGIFATQFDEEFTFELYYGETLMQTLTYSVNAYATAMENDALALALYRYGASAEAYAPTANN